MNRITEVEEKVIPIWDSHNLGESFQFEKRATFDCFHFDCRPGIAIAQHLSWR